MIIAIDGPTASGKGTIAKRIAAHYGFHLLDTGLLYRAVARAVLDAGQSLDDSEGANGISLKACRCSSVAGCNCPSLPYNEGLPSVCPLGIMEY